MSFQLLPSLFEIFSDGFDVNKPPFLSRKEFESRKIVDGVFEFDIADLKLIESIESIQKSIFISEETMIFRIIEVVS